MKLPPPKRTVELLLRFQLQLQERPTVKRTRKIAEAARGLARDPETGNHTPGRGFFVGVRCGQNASLYGACRLLRRSLLYNPRQSVLESISGRGARHRDWTRPCCLDQGDCL